MSDRPRRDPPEVDGMFTLKIDNISYRTTTDLLREKFERYGEIGDVYIPRDFHSHEPKGFAFVRFVNDREGEDALREMDGKEIDGRIIRIQEAKEKRRSIRDYDNRDRRGYGGRDRDYGRRRDYDDRGPRRSDYGRDRDMPRRDDRDRYEKSRRDDSEDRGRERGHDRDRMDRDRSRDRERDDSRGRGKDSRSRSR